MILLHREKGPPSESCTILVHKQFTSLPKDPIVLRLENFPTTEAAQSVATPASTVVEAVGKIWLLILATKGERSPAALS